MKTIAIDIDDTLNDFSETLAAMEFTYDEKYGLDQETFKKYLHWIKTEMPDGERKNKELVKLRLTLHREIYKAAKVKPGASEFVQWLKSEGWRIVIMTYRDLRYVLEDTKDWLQENGIPYNYIFSTEDKTSMCNVWGINYLIEDSIREVVIAPEFDIQVFYPIMQKHLDMEFETKAIGYSNFKELKQCIA